MTDRTRILFVNHTAQMGGPTHSLLMLVRYLRTRYEMGVLLPEYGPLQERLLESGVDTFVIPGLHTRAIPKIAQLIHQQEFDLVYGNNPDNCARNAMLAAKLTRRPFIWHFRGVKWHWTWRKGGFLRGADAVIAVSQACAKPLQRFYPAEKIHVVYNGVDTSAFAVDRQEARQHLLQEVGLDPSAYVLISVSHLLPRKQQGLSIAMMAHVIQQRPDAHLLIAGSTERDRNYTNQVNREIERLGLKDNVHILGLRSDIAHLLRGADVFVHSSEREAHPRAVLEAMAAGLPTVAFAVDGVTEAVVHGETGFLLPFGDVEEMAERIGRLQNESSLAESMGRRAQTHVETHFKATQTAQRVSEIIDWTLPHLREAEAPGQLVP